MDPKTKIKIEDKDLKSLLVRIDSFLTCLIHRHGKMIEDIGEYDEVHQISYLLQDYSR